MFIKVTSAWQQGAGIGVRVSGAWKPVTAGWVNVQGAWKPFSLNIPALRIMGTAQGSGSNDYHYETISQAAMTVASGDKLAFEVYLGPNTGQISMEAHYTKSGSSNQSLRDLGTIVDQNGKPIHPGNRFNENNKGKWFYRVFDLTPIAGASMDTWAVAIEDDSAGVKTGYFRNIKVLNSEGAVKLDIFKDTITVPGLSTFYGTTSRYTDISKVVVESPF